MLFADQALAVRVEHAEAALLREAADCVAGRLPAGQVWHQDIGGGVAAFTESGAPLNKVAGAGFAGALPEPELEEIERRFVAVGEPVRFEVSTLADPVVAEQLTRRGYVLRAFENVLGIGLPTRATYRPPVDLLVAESSARDLESWLDIMVAGFCAPDTDGAVESHEFESELLRRIMGDLMRASGIARYTASLGGVPVGGAAMRMSDGIAQLCGAATLPLFRRRGVQTALLAERLRIAAEAGCDLAVVTTQPGSKSMQNTQRRGFELLYSRAVLVRESG